jgi:hypothetical protein
VLLQLGIGGGGGRDCIRDYEREACSLAFHYGLGTLISRHQLLTHDHLQVIGDDAGTLAEIRKHEWIKISGHTGAEIIIATQDIRVAPESSPFGMIILQVPERYDLAHVGAPARIQRSLTHAQLMGSAVYYPAMTFPIDSIYPYTSPQIWDKLTVGVGRTGATRSINGTAFYAVAYGEGRPILQNGDCGGGSFMLVEGELLLVGTHNYTTSAFYLYLPIRQ